MFWSDHLPIVIECELSAIICKNNHCSINRINKAVWGYRTKEQIKSYTKLCNSKLKLIDFPVELRQCSCDICNCKEHRIYLDKLYKDIIRAITDSAINTSNTQSYKRKKKHVIGWNKHVCEAHREARSKFLYWVSQNRPQSGTVYEEMCESRKLFKKRLKWCYNNKEQLKMEIISECRASKNFSDFWKATNSLNHKTGLPVSVGGASDSRDIAELFREHFTTKSPLGPCSADPGSSVTGELYNVSAKQVRQIVSSMSRGKSPGHDGLSIEHFKYAGVHLPRVLAMFYTLCLNHSYLPPDLMKTIIVPIVKNKTGDLSDKNNYRPISLATIVAKVLDSVLDSELDKHLNIHDAQFGFRAGLSTESAILSLKHTVQYYTKRNTPVYACFLDLSKAFDLVSYDLLWEKLKKTGVPTQVQRIFHFWYRNQNNYVRWANTFSDTYRLECGVRQGGLSSPKLFNLYVNELIVGLSSTRVGCWIDNVCMNNFSYADDMVLLTPTVNAMRQLLTICQSYSLQHGLKYNADKSVYMVFRAPGKCRLNVPAIKLSGIELKRVEQFKYLGHYVTEDLDDNVDIERERRALAVRSNMLARRFRTLSALRVQYNNGFRMLLGLPRFCSASSMFAEARVDGFHAIVRKRLASLLSRVRSSTNSILRVIAEKQDANILQAFLRAQVL
ncbi:uncharacterized protein LOC126911962 [Spodoptera frugiperda]|uniref:Uncharacterized protein LOC126911962 n=1 Tax=Spodoptera frugiperda TaxID=7108 RepID=A0A9R0EZX8_SPOFR|nr:uncharacterized protein LOC126911962 [Spodoptera frugiperda]